MRVASFVLDFLQRIALGLGSVLVLLAIMGLGIPRRIVRAVRPRHRY
jgi:hypothetical protein